MLIFTRKESESFMIGDDITIIILRVKGRQVSIGIDAPKETPVHREEIYHKIQMDKAHESKR